MSKIEDKFNRQRLRSSYASVVVSISLVLTLIGIVSIFVLRAKILEKETKESYKFSVLLKKEASNTAIRQFLKELDVAPYVKSTAFISKDEAAEFMKQELGEDFLQFIGESPFPNSIDIQLKAEYVETEKIEQIKEEIQSSAIVDELAYDANKIEIVTENLKVIITYLLGGALLLLVISIALINSSIRLSIYSKRFLIKTMQLVGATRNFIQKPFIFRSLKLGLIGAIIALILLSGMVYLSEKYWAEFISFKDIEILAVTGGAIVVFGLFISWICTWFAVNKYLKLKTDELYF